MDHYVSSEFDRPLKIRTQKSIVHYERKIPGLANPTHRRKIRHNHRRIRWRLHINHPRVRFDRGFDVLQTRSVYITELKTEIDEQFFRQPKTSAITRLRKNRVLARPQQPEPRIDRRHPGSEHIRR